MKVQVGIYESQAESAQLQAFLASAQTSGIDSPQARRMTNGAIDLYYQMVKKDQTLSMYRNALPRISKDEYDNALLTAKTQAELEDIEATFSRLVDSSRPLYSGGQYAIILSSNFKLTNALQNYQKARALVSQSGYVRGRIYLNDDNMYAIGLSGFDDRDKALKSLSSLHQDLFRGPYIANTSGWRIVCDNYMPSCLSHLENIVNIHRH